jgi:hypothetical protein
MYEQLVDLIAQSLTPDFAQNEAQSEDESESLDGDQLLQFITAFIARYLQCSLHQSTVLALWILHTYCRSAAQVTPYLSIRSAHKQSGKTLCLQLLSLLCDFPGLTAGFTAASLKRHIEGPAHTILLDECHASLGTRTRSKAPTLRAILATGFHRATDHATAIYDHRHFCAKAFAGMGELPEELADRSLPIILNPRGSCGTANRVPNTRAGFARAGVEVPSALASQQKLQRFHLSRATEESKPLRRQLQAWSNQNIAELRERPAYAEEDFPPNLTPRQQDMCEPLLQLADFVGEEWPVRIRQALVAIWDEETVFNLQPSLQLLEDIHRCFFYHGFPDRLSTADLLDWMHALPARPWDVDGPLSAHKLARLLMPFAIWPRVQRIGSTSRARGYQLADFREPWQKHLGLQPAPIAIANQGAEIASKDGPCHAVTVAGVPSVSHSENGSSHGETSPPGRAASRKTPSQLSKSSRKRASRTEYHVGGHPA